MNARPVNGPMFGQQQHNQPVPSPVWIINHKMNKHPNVLLFMANGTTAVGAQIDYPDLDNVHVYFNRPESGRAVLQ